MNILTQRVSKKGMGDVPPVPHRPNPIDAFLNLNKRNYLFILFEGYKPPLKISMKTFKK